MIEELTESNCYYPLNQGIYFIYDDELNNVPNFLSENDRWNLKIVNDSENVINFLQNDGCLMIQNEMKKCDWICFDQNDFYFIEAKDVKPKSRSSQRNDAIKKFDATIPYFLNLYPNLVNMRLFVIMNFRSSNLTNAANKAKAAYFEDKYNAKYIETNILEFI